jgi:cathepsin B
MKVVLLLALIITVSCAAVIPSTWTAGHNSYFNGWDRKAVKLMLGVNRSKASTLTKVTPAARTLPASFDARTQWPGCIGAILDQGRCGSCWAFGAAASFSDRLCIASRAAGKNISYLRLSELDLVVNDQNDNGCQGGNLDSAFSYIHKKGIVTESCLPYGTWEFPAGPIKTCANASEPCMPDTFIPTPNPSTTCKNSATFSADKHKAASVNSVSGATDMMNELVTNGPFEVAFDVYEDFLNYKSGVYIRSSSDMLGGHAVRVIGYGVENGTNYWLVANSWTTVWGDQGYFKIQRGTNMCGIEQEAAFGTPAL